MHDRRQRIGDAAVIPSMCIGPALERMHDNPQGSISWSCQKEGHQAGPRAGSLGGTTELRSAGNLEMRVGHGVTHNVLEVRACTFGCIVFVRGMEPLENFLLGDSYSAKSVYERCGVLRQIHQRLTQDRIKCGTHVEEHDCSRVVMGVTGSLMCIKEVVCQVGTHPSAAAQLEWGDLGLPHCFELGPNCTVVQLACIVGHKNGAVGLWVIGWPFSFVQWDQETSPPGKRLDCMCGGFSC